MQPQIKNTPPQIGKAYVSEDINNNKMDTSGQIQNTWDFAKNFLETPPTSSIFRLYLLSFIIWNKGVMLYILFGSADMADKLAVVNFGKYVPHFYQVSGWQTFISMYLGPLIIFILIYGIVFWKGFGKVSLFEYFKTRTERLNLDFNSFLVIESDKRAEVTKANAEKLMNSLKDIDEIFTKLDEQTSNVVQRTNDYISNNKDSVNKLKEKL